MLLNAPVRFASLPITLPILEIHVGIHAFLCQQSDNFTIFATDAGFLQDKYNSIRKSKDNVGYILYYVYTKACAPIQAYQNMHTYLRTQWATFRSSRTQLPSTQAHCWHINHALQPHPVYHVSTTNPTQILQCRVSFITVLHSNTSVHQQGKWVHRRIIFKHIWSSTRQIGFVVE